MTPFESNGAALPSPPPDYNQKYDRLQRQKSQAHTLLLLVAVVGLPAAAYWLARRMGQKHKTAIGAGVAGLVLGLYAAIAEFAPGGRGPIRWIVRRLFPVPTGPFGQAGGSPVGNN